MIRRSTDWLPLDPCEHEAQIAGLRAFLGKPPRRVLDLGSGDGRVALPLARAGHHIVAIDSDARAVRTCAARHRRIAARRDDFLARQFDPGALGGPFDAILCLGHTFMLVHRPAQALTLLTRLRASAPPGGRLFIDDFTPLWREVASGNWPSGVSEDGSSQLVWVRDDNVFALRHGRGVDPRRGQVRESDRLHRLWSRGELTLLAAATGWSAPRRTPSAFLTHFTRTP